MRIHKVKILQGGKMKNEEENNEGEALGKKDKIMREEGGREGERGRRKYELRRKRIYLGQ